MKHRRLFVGSIIAIPVGIIFWAIIGPTIAFAGISSHQEGWWIFSQTVTDITATYWVGVALSILGLIIMIAGITGIILVFVLELLDREKQPPTQRETSIAKPPE